MEHSEVLAAMPEHTRAAVAAYLGSVRDVQQDYYREHGRYVQRLRTNSAPGGPDGWTEPLTVAVDMAESLRCWHRIDSYTSERGDGFIVVIEDGKKRFSFAFGPDVGLTGVCDDSELPK